MKRTNNFSSLLLVLFFLLTASLTLYGNESYARGESKESDMELLINSEKEIAGYSKVSDIHFSTQDMEDSILETNVYMGVKHIRVKVGYGKRTGEIHILGEDMNTKDIVTLSDDEAGLLRMNLQSMLEEETGAGRLEQNLLRTFNLLSSWPSSLAVTLDPDNVDIPDECGLEYPDGISENICYAADRLHIGRYATEGEYCGWATHYGVPVLQLDEPTEWKENAEHLAGGPDCFGRCGRGCIGDGEPNNDVDIYTQDCFDHDLCAENVGLLDALCNWMFISAIDDFFYGPLCIPDSDGDGIPDGDGSNYCTGGKTEYCDDNCINTPNEDQADFDGDGVGDVCDNCREVKNWDQKDSNFGEDDNTDIDGDQHYGNACDMDIDNNGFTGIEDFNSLRTCFGNPASPDCDDLDCDDGGFIGLEDFNCLRTYFGGPPGPGIGD